jgi:hypothetical protein
MTLSYLALQQSSTDWIPIGISLLALVGTLGNYLITLSRGRKHVHIMSWVHCTHFAGQDRQATYYCRVTNTGYIGLQVNRVDVRIALVQRPHLVGFLHLPSGEKPKKLDQGESQEWGIALNVLLDGLHASVVREQDSEAKVIAVAWDTTGKEYVEKQKDAWPILDLLSLRVARSQSDVP